MKGDKFTADNPAPKPGKRTSLTGQEIPDEWFANESDGPAVLKSEAVSEEQIDKEEAALDALLAGDDTKFNKLNEG